MPKIKNIKWDMKGHGEIAQSLPSEVELPDYILIPDSDMIDSYLIDEYGFGTLDWEWED